MTYGSILPLYSFLSFLRSENPFTLLGGILLRRMTKKKENPQNPLIPVFSPKRSADREKTNNKIMVTDKRGTLNRESNVIAILLYSVLVF